MNIQKTSWHPDPEPVPKAPLDHVEGTVYFITCDHPDFPIKIGFATEPRLRLTMMKYISAPIPATRKVRTVQWPIEGTAPDARKQCWRISKLRGHTMADTTKADLAAANKEASQLMDSNRILKKEAAEAYQNGYRDALQAADNLARICQTQAGMITYFMGMLVGGMKPGTHQ